MAVDPTGSGKGEKPKFTGAEKIRMRQIIKENPVYFDKIIRDFYGPPPSKKKPAPSKPNKKNTKQPTRVVLNKGGSVTKGKK